MNKIQQIKDLISAPSAQLLRHKKTLSKVGGLVWSILRIIILLAIGYIIIYPLVYMIMTSFRSLESFNDSARIWIPSSVDIGFNYSKAIEFTEYWRGLKNTVVFEIVAGIIEVVTCSIAAYGLARFKFKGKGILMACLFLTILIPEIMLIIPRMVIYSKMDFLGILGLVESISGIDLRPNLIGTPWAFYLPSFFAMGLRSGILIFIYIQFFKSLPYELEEAAWVDGAGPVRTFISIALPSSSVVFTTVTVFSIIWHWNDTFLASMYVKTSTLFPLSVALDRISMTMAGAGYYQENNPQSQAILMAACFLFILPPLIFYMFMQRRFIESIDRVGITG